MAEEEQLSRTFKEGCDRFLDSFRARFRPAQQVVLRSIIKLSGAATISALSDSQWDERLKQATSLYEVRFDGVDPKVLEAMNSGAVDKAVAHMAITSAAAAAAPTAPVMASQFAPSAPAPTMVAPQPQPPQQQQEVTAPIAPVVAQPTAAVTSSAAFQDAPVRASFGGAEEASFTPFAPPAAIEE
jgi:hypothetical protein